MVRDEHNRILPNQSHPIFANPLFSNVDLIDRLRAKVSCRIPTENDAIQSTGIPVHVTLLRRFDDFKVQLQNFQNPDIG